MCKNKLIADAIIEKLNNMPAEKAREKYEDLYNEFFSSIASDDERPDRKARQMLEAISSNDLNAFCMAISGWEIKSQLVSSGLITQEEISNLPECDFFVLESARGTVVTKEDIDDIMCCAVEGGINYWCSEAAVPKGEEYLGEYASEQISRGGTLKLYDSESGEEYTLTRDLLLKGIALAISQSYYSGYNWYAGGTLDACQIDADVADVIIQLALFDDIIYG